ncbi:hypothetical protein [Carboxylicivirga sp. N1Y90]|uniref:hypothetical protein n=1 Tax=Carboxylicivirga fragile TaxID=3417571 RepID=UPI003D34617B|nr:hypothetical protein [Marinilabiliaceae bacterium N1Y90]
MRYIFTTIIILGYILFGYFWIQTSYQIITQNVFIETFTFNKISTSTVSYTNKNNDSKNYIISYQYEINDKLYTNELIVDKQSFADKVGLHKESLNIMYNQQLPMVSYIEGWELKTSHKFNLILFSIFLGITILGNLFLKAENKRLKEVLTQH